MSWIIKAVAAAAVAAVVSVPTTAFGGGFRAGGRGGYPACQQRNGAGWGNGQACYPSPYQSAYGPAYGPQYQPAFGQPFQPSFGPQFQPAFGQPFQPSVRQAPPQSRPEVKVIYVPAPAPARPAPTSPAAAPMKPSNTNYVGQVPVVVNPNDNFERTRRESKPRPDSGNYNSNEFRNPRNTGVPSRNSNNTIR